MNNGYRCLHSHECGGHRGDTHVYEHRYVMEQKIGRRLNKDENIHHKDGNKLNNDIDNLELLSAKNHGHVHKGVKLVTVCERCGEKTINEKYCSFECRDMSQRKVLNRPSKEELEQLAWSLPISTIAASFGVSDKSVKKWCTKLGILTPPRGYWAKQRSIKHTAD